MNARLSGCTGKAFMWFLVDLSPFYKLPKIAMIPEMDPISNPYAPGAGTPPPELAGRDELLETVRVAVQRVKRGLPASDHAEGLAASLTSTHFAAPPSAYTKRPAAAMSPARLSLAKELAQKVVIRKEDGKIQTEYTYGEDPRSRQG